MIYFFLNLSFILKKMLIKKRANIENCELWDDVHLDQKIPKIKNLIIFKKTKPKIPKINSDLKELILGAAKNAKILFWQKILIDMSKNKLPDGFRIDDRTLIFSDEKKTDSLFISDNNVYTNITSFMMKNNFIPTDENLGISWIKLSRDRKNKIIEHFIERTVESESMTKEAAARFEDIIRISFYLGYFTKKNIILENQEIVEITDLIKNKHGEYMVRPSIVKKKTSSASKCKEKKINFNCIEKWYNYHGASFE